MKTLRECINEAKTNFVLTNGERNSLNEILGYITGNLGNKSNQIQFNDLIKSLSDEQLKQIEDLFNLTEDDVTYPKLNRSLLKNDIELLKIILKWIDERGHFETEYELWNILDKIS